jgi:hypothetical protein
MNTLTLQRSHTTHHTHVAMHTYLYMSLTGTLHRRITLLQPTYSRTNLQERSSSVTFSEEARMRSASARLDTRIATSAETDGLRRLHMREEEVRMRRSSTHCRPCCFRRTASTSTALPKSHVQHALRPRQLLRRARTPLRAAQGRMTRAVTNTKAKPLCLCPRAVTNTKAKPFQNTSASVTQDEKKKTKSLFLILFFISPQKWTKKKPYSRLFFCLVTYNCLAAHVG